MDSLPDHRLLRAIEPENTELDLLLDTFEHMVDNQIKQGSKLTKSTQTPGMPNIHEH